MVVSKKRPVMITLKMIEVLLAIENGPPKYVTKIAKFSGTQYGMITRIIDVFEKKNIIERKSISKKWGKKGREKYIFLTPKGKELAIHLAEVKRLWL